MARGTHETAAVLYTVRTMSPTLVIATIVAVLLAVYLVVAMLAPERFG
jgi:K+-transporting ATPase KdpF subunit